MYPSMIASLLMIGSLTAVPEQMLVGAAKAQIGVTKYYDSRYRPLQYPNGDLPLDRGVCTDVVIRAYRFLDVDLQKLVHVDMSANWGEYPNPWKAKTTDTNIDHRRVLNLATFFTRHGGALPITADPKDYRPGDIVTWTLTKGLPHIGIVSNDIGSQGFPLMIHNIGYGTKLDDILFFYKITGHFRYFPRGLTGRSTTAPAAPRTQPQAAGPVNSVR